MLLLLLVHHLVRVINGEEWLREDDDDGFCRTGELENASAYRQYCGQDTRGGQRRDSLC